MGDSPSIDNYCCYTKENYSNDHNFSVICQDSQMSTIIILFILGQGACDLIDYYCYSHMHIVYFDFLRINYYYSVNI